MSPPPPCIDRVAAGGAQCLDATDAAAATAARRPASLMERKKEGKKGPSGQERRKPSLNLYDSGLVQLAMKANAGYLTSAVLCSSPSEICRRLCKLIQEVKASI